MCLLGIYLEAPLPLRLHITADCLVSICRKQLPSNLTTWCMMTQILRITPSVLSINSILRTTTMTLISVSGLTFSSMRLLMPGSLTISLSLTSVSLCLWPTLSLYLVTATLLDVESGLHLLEFYPLLSPMGFLLGFAACLVSKPQVSITSYHSCFLE